MKKITGQENISELISLDEKVAPLMEQYGLGNYLKPESLKKTGRFIRLNTLLKANKIDVESFVGLLNQNINAEVPGNKTMLQDDLHFSAMLPCGLRNPFKEYVESFILDQEETFAGFNYLMEGNVNHELSYYPLLDSIQDTSELPDIIMASDVNNFFHRPFIERFIEKGAFKTYQPHTPNAYLEKAAYADPNGNFTMYTANMLIMVVDKQKLGNRPMPTRWDDLLSPEFENDIIMRGEDDFFCNAVMLPFFKDHGFDAIQHLAKNIKAGLHPAEMVKLAGKNTDEGAAVYIMPYFFAKRIKSSTAEIVWPEDGAIASPVFILVKAGVQEKHKAILEFLFNKQTGEMLKDRYFPGIHPEVNHETFPEQVKWLGWDFLSTFDIGDLKDQIREEFMKVWK